MESHTNLGQPRLVVGAPRAVVNMEVSVQETMIGIVIATETRGAMMKIK